jgi:hypothetical protein
MCVRPACSKAIWLRYISGCSIKSQPSTLCPRQPEHAMVCPHANYSGGHQNRVQSLMCVRSPSFKVLWTSVHIPRPREIPRNSPQPPLCRPWRSITSKRYVLAALLLNKREKSCPDVSKWGKPASSKWKNTLWHVYLGLENRTNVLRLPKCPWLYLSHMPLTSPTGKQ